MFRPLSETIRYLRRPSVSWGLLLAVLVLCGAGLVVLSSAGQSASSDIHFIVRRQALWFVPAIVAGFLAAMVDLEYLRRYTWPLAAAAVLLLLLVFVPKVGVTVNGARRWLELGFARLQVSDPAKIMLIFVLAHYYGNRQRSPGDFWQSFVIPCCIIGVCSGLIIVQPDFGTAALCGAVGFALMFLAGVRLIYLLPVCIGGLAAFSVLVWRDPVRLSRVISFWNVEENKLDSGYQLWEGLRAFEAGGISGVGLGNGRQQLFFLPEAHTDFIFSIIGEELGLFVTCGIVLVFALIFILGVYGLRRAPNLFQFLLATGALLFLSLQALINMLVVTGLAPTKGMSLPFISYGGSNLVAMFVLIGILFNCLRTWAVAPVHKVSEL